MNTSAAGALNREILSEDGNLPFLLGPIDRNIGGYYTYSVYKLSLQIILYGNVSVYGVLHLC